MEILKEITQPIQLSSNDVAALIANNTVDLFFDDFGSESSQPVEAFFQEAQIETLDEATFRQVLNLPIDDPQYKITQFLSAEEVLAYFEEIHRPLEFGKKAAFIVELMQQNLTQISVVVLGEDYHEEVPPEHFVYVVGVGKEGCLAGFKSQVIWT